MLENMEWSVKISWFNIEAFPNLKLIVTAHVVFYSLLMTLINSYFVEIRQVNIYAQFETAEAQWSADMPLV